MTAFAYAGKMLHSKTNQSAYKEANDHLIDSDQAGEGFRLKAIGDDEGWKVLNRDGKEVEILSYLCFFCFEKNKGGTGAGQIA